MKTETEKLINTWRRLNGVRVKVEAGLRQMAMQDDRKPAVKDDNWVQQVVDDVRDNPPIQSLIDCIPAEMASRWREELRAHMEAVQAKVTKELDEL